MKVIKFGGFDWEIKDSGNFLVGPGPNLFSDKNVFISDKGLHLKTSIIEKHLYSGEAQISRTLGFGKYEFSIEAELNNLEKNHVFGAFLYRDDLNEIDIEISESMVGKDTGQYVVQPSKIRGNRIKFKIPKTKKSYHFIHWHPEHIKFESRNLPSGKLIHQAIYTGESIPKKEDAFMIFNLWLYKGKKPRKPEEIIITKFNFTPLQI